MSNLTYEDVPDDAKAWNMPFNREYKDFGPTLQPQVGFEITGIKNALLEFCSSHQTPSDRCTIGFFIYFYGDDGNMVSKISDIKFKKLEAVFHGDSSNEHWLTRWANKGGEIALEPLEPQQTIKAKGWVISHYQPDVAGSNYATPNSARTTMPRLLLNEQRGEDSDDKTVSDYGIQTIRGYRAPLRIAYLDYGTLMHMFLAYGIPGGVSHTEDELKFIFTGAEINHGELVSPYFQQERFIDWGHDFPGLDTSITPTLKMEGVYKIEGTTNEYQAAELHPVHTSSNPNISLPGVKVLAPCRRFWQLVEQVVNSASAQTPFNDPVVYARQRYGILNLSREFNSKATKKQFRMHYPRIDAPY